MSRQSAGHHPAGATFRDSTGDGGATPMSKRWNDRSRRGRRRGRGPAAVAALFCALLTTTLPTPPAPARAGVAAAATLPVNRPIDVSRIQVRPAVATHRALDAASRRIVALADAHQLPYAIGMVGPAADASGVEVDVAGTPGAPPP